MLITPVNSFKTNIPSFGINLQSRQLRFKNDDFFVRMKGYGTNSDWAEMIIHTADIAVNFIRTNFDFENILIFITEGVKKANQFPSDIEKRIHTGILRTKRKDWLYGSAWNTGYIKTNYDGQKSKYKPYADRFERTVHYPLKNPYKKFMLTRPIHDKDDGKMLEHASPYYINHSLDMVGDLYNGLHDKYIAKEATTADLDNINSVIAEIRWILAHATPWERGSDAISNTFMRAIYKAIGIKSYPLKRGVSLDLEAYCTNLDEYKKNFSAYFTHKPVIAD